VDLSLAGRHALMTGSSAELGEAIAKNTCVGFNASGQPVVSSTGDILEDSMIAVKGRVFSFPTDWLYLCIQRTRIHV
jgi:hypothetical protein